MPHVRLETTADLPENADVIDILDSLVATLCSFETIGAPGVKASHTMHRQWVQGAGAAPGFVHLEVALLAGRPPELLARIADGMDGKLREHFAASLESGEAKATMELRQMDPVLYRK